MSHIENWITFVKMNHKLESNEKLLAHVEYNVGHSWKNESRSEMSHTRKMDLP